MGKSLGLSTLELKALSVPSSLRFLLGVEYDVLLAVTETGKRRPCTIRFPVLGNNFQKLLELCADRFKLVCTHHADHSIFTGTAVAPPLRYVDYLPGALSAEELLSCLGVTDPITSPVPYEGSFHDFLASFVDYSEYGTDASLADVHGTGFYLTLDYGLSTATHSHLVRIGFHKCCTVEEALREFEEFSGWSNFDIRFEDVDDKPAGGVVVMPSIQDACDLFEKYEDEDSDDEGGNLPFVLRPVAPLTSVPSVEDSALKKLRDQQWGEIEKYWERFPKWKNCVVVSNLYDSASLEETLALFSSLNVTSSSFVEDDSPARRRRVFVTFATADDAKRALAVDGKSTKGKTLRVQVSPPYLDEDRRGRVVGSRPLSASGGQTRQSSAGGEAPPSGLIRPAPAPEKQDAAAAGGGAAIDNVDVTTSSGRGRNGSKTVKDDKSSNKVMLGATTPTHVATTSPPVGSISVGSEGKKQMTSSLLPAPQPPQYSPPVVVSTMNANAREFIPSSSSQARMGNSPDFFVPTIQVNYMVESFNPPPPCYQHVAAPSANMIRPVSMVPRNTQFASPPPPYSQSPQPFPPPYTVATRKGMQIAQQQPPPPQHPPLSPPSWGWAAPAAAETCHIQKK